VVAVDPTSPFTGGSFLGDRIRLQRHCQDDAVFVRSMATRHATTGSVAPATSSVVSLLDASGKDVVFIETTGAGQTQFDVTCVADTVVVVLAPESGDSIQTMKAGQMEIADIFVVNKADRRGVDRLVMEVESSVSMRHRRDVREIPVITAQAASGIGVDTVYESVRSHWQFLQAGGGLSERRGEQRAREVVDMLERTIIHATARTVTKEPQIIERLAAVRRGELDPSAAFEEIVKTPEFARSLLAYVAANGPASIAP
jgi:LAO/AO transport system kinase